VIKKTKYILVIGFCCLAVMLSGVEACFAQSQQGINYQAVARDNSGNPLAIATVTVSFNIHRSAPTGLVSFSESPSITTNPFGLFTWVIGSSNYTGFDSIAWGKHKYFLEVIVNGTNNMGTTQFMSVPYAFHAHTADSVKNLPANLSPWTKTGGKIFPFTLTDSVGIGTAIPSAKLQVIGKTKTDTVQITSGSPTAGKVLTSVDASGKASWQIPAFTTMQTFTTTAVWTIPAGVNKIMVEVWGGGGGGGSSSGSGSLASGGGGGGYGKGIYAVTPSTTYSITVGTGGVVGTTGTAGYLGGTSSFGSLISASGGGGGTSGNSMSVGAGGNSFTGAQFTIAGGAGFTGCINYLNFYLLPHGGMAGNGGMGGSGFSNATGGFGVAPGGGGGGSVGSPTPGLGGMGASGRVVVWW